MRLAACHILDDAKRLRFYLCSCHEKRLQQMAEGVGFEPTRAFALPVFKTGAINHSTTPPLERCSLLCHRLLREQGLAQDEYGD